MLKAARAQGSPMMVIAIRRAARNQPAAAKTPPKISHNMFSNRLRSGMTLSRFDDVARTGLGSTAEIAEFPVEIEIARRDLTLHPAQAILEHGEFAIELLDRIVGGGRDAAPELLLLGVGIKRARSRTKRQGQDDVGQHRRREEQHQGDDEAQAHDDRLDTEIAGDAGADAGEDAAVGVAIEPVPIDPGSRHGQPPCVLRQPGASASSSRSSASMRASM